MRARRPWILIVGGLILAGIGAGIAFGLIRWPDPDPRFARYPELLEADEAICTRLRKRWRKEGEIRTRSGQRFPILSWGYENALDGATKRAPLALLRVMYEKAEALNPLVVDRGSYTRDEATHSPAWWLAEHPSPSLVPVLLRMVEDRNLHDELRRSALIALASPDNRGIMARLANLACDINESSGFRHDVLARLPRLQAELPGPLEELLYQPFHSLNLAAAAALALTGRCEAPSLILDGIRDRFIDGGLAQLLAEAVTRIAREDPEIGALASTFSELQVVAVTTHESWDSQKLRASAALARAFEQWLDEHPDALDTRFERARRAYLAGAQRKKERAIQTFDELVEATDDAVDFAAAYLIATDRPEEFRDWILLRLNMLVELLRSDLEGLGEPEAVIAALNRRLLVRTAMSTYQGVKGPSSFLEWVLKDHCGNCVGLTSLYAAVAERLDLPVHAVALPMHVFVRWDDGTVRSNLELTAGGEEISDDDYLANYPDMTADAVARGVYLANLTKKQLLARVLGNWADWYCRSEMARRPENWDHAFRHAARAIRLDPAFGPAYLHRGYARLKKDASAVGTAMKDFERAIQLHAPPLATRIFIAGALTEFEHWARALRWVKEGLAIDPGNEKAKALRRKCEEALERAAPRQP